MQASELNVPGWHRVVRFQDEGAGLDTIIALHNVNLGPGCGGVRVRDYATFDDGLEDVKNLSRGMTYKNALGRIPFGGGKAVIFANPHKDKTEAMMEAFGKALEQMGGQYIAAQDSGMTTEDMRIAGRHTDYVSGIPDAQGRGGNPSPHTAYGVWQGIKAVTEHLFGCASLAGRTIAINGVGAVGMPLAAHLHADGASLIVADINEAAVKESEEKFGAQAASIDEIASVDADIFAPCALGGAINKDTIDRLNVKAIAGASNNQLKTPDMGQALKDKGILYAPDFVINAGGVISIGHEVMGNWQKETLYKTLDGIPKTLSKVFERAEKEDRLTGDVADEMAEEMFRA